MAQSNKLIIIAVAIIFALALLGCTQPTAQDNNIGSGTLKDNNTNIIGDNNNSGKTSADSNNNIYNNLNQFKVVKKGDKISVDYTGKFTDGNIFDTSKKEGRTPLEFTVGAGQMIPGFDAAVVGMKVGETKTVTLPPEQAYGPLVALDTNYYTPGEVPDFNKLKVGDKLATANPQYYGEVVEKNDTNVKISIYNAMAGKTLIFEITLISIN